MAASGESSPTDAASLHQQRVRMGRLNKEMKGFKDKPPMGITCKPKENSYDVLVAQIRGPEGSPYERGTFNLEIKIPAGYPIEPPLIKFVTPVYHPNIDQGGVICMDLLKVKENGWLATVSLETLLVAIQYLLSHPNPDDPLVDDIAREFLYDHDSFVAKAREHTERNAMNN